MNMRFLPLLLLTTTAALATGCSHESEDGNKGAAGAPGQAAPRQPDGSGSAEVTYRPGVHVI